MGKWCIYTYHLRERFADVGAQGCAPHAYQLKRIHPLQNRIYIKNRLRFCVFWSAFSALVRLLAAWLEPAARQPNPLYEIEILKLLPMGRKAVRPMHINLV
jgi:hypothetical protein